MYVFSALGLYPSIPGVGGLVVTGPVFQGVTMRLGGNRTLHITAADADSLHPYIRSMSVNGEPYTRTWLPTSMIGPNTSIAFVMSGEPDKEWGSKAGEAPPSFAGPGQ
jgi:putative alpha-1,2-mannosidase